MFGKSEQDKVSLSSADNSQGSEEEASNYIRNDYIEKAEKILGEFYSDCRGCEGADGFTFSFEKRIRKSGNEYGDSFVFSGLIKFNEIGKRYCFKRNNKEVFFENGDNFIKAVEEHVKNMKQAENVISQMGRLVETRRCMRKQVGGMNESKVFLELCNKDHSFYYEEDKALEKIELNLENVNITLFPKGSSGNGEVCSVEELSKKIDTLLSSIEDYEKRCIGISKNYVEEIFGEIVWQLDKGSKEWKGSIKVEGIDLPVSVRAGFRSGSEVCICGKEIASFSLDQNSFKDEIKKFKAFFEEYAKKFMSFKGRGILNHTLIIKMDVWFLFQINLVMVVLKFRVRCWVKKRISL